MATRKITATVLAMMALLLVFTGCNKPTGTVVPQVDLPSDSVAPPPTDLPAEPAEIEPAIPVSQDAAIFIAHTTIPTGTVIGPGLIFTKTWEIENRGNTVWTADYHLVFDDGEPMGAPGHQPLFAHFEAPPAGVLPGQAITLTTILTSPLVEGPYTGTWLLQNPAGSLFGMGELDADPLLVDIVVQEGAGLPGFGLGDRLPLGDGQPNGVQSVDLSVSPADYSGDCPVQLVFSGAIDVTGVGPFSYNYVHDVDTSLPGWEFLIPPPQTFNYDSPGWHTIQTNFSVFIPEDADGWIRLESDGPDSSSFSEIYYNVDCND